MVDRTQGGATVLWWAEAREAAKHSTMHRTAPQQRTIQPKKSILPRLRNPIPKAPSLTPSPPLAWLAPALGWTALQRSFVGICTYW